MKNKKEILKGIIKKPAGVLLLFAFAISFCVSYFVYQQRVFAYGGIESYQAGDIVSIGDNQLTVHFVDVGQGDSCIIELPDNRTVLIDSGVNTNAVKNKLNTYITDLSQQRKDANKPEILYFDFVIITHSDADHCGSMAYILGLYPAHTFYRPNEESTYTGYTDPATHGAEPHNRFWGDENGHGSKNTVTYKNAIEAGYRYNQQLDILPQGIVTNPHDDTQNTISPQDADPEEYYEINFYGPIKSKYSDFNNYSPIIIIEYMGRRIALSGDSEKDGEADFVAAAKRGEGRYAVFNQAYYADIIKAGHHGSRTSSGQAYLDVLTTTDSILSTYFVISCGQGNSYGHPHQEVLDRVYAMGFLENQILRTDQMGDIVVVISYNQEQEGKADIKLLGREEELPPPTEEPEEPKEDEKQVPAPPKSYFNICGFAGGNDGKQTLILLFVFIAAFALVIKKRGRTDAYKTK